MWRPLMLLGEARPSAGWAFAALCPDVDPGGCQHHCDVLFVETNPRPKSRGWIPGLCHFRRRRPRGARCGPAGLRGSSGPCWGPGRAGLQHVAGQPGGTTRARLWDQVRWTGLWAPHVSAAGWHVLWGNWGAPVQSPHVGLSVSFVVEGMSPCSGDAPLGGRGCCLSLPCRCRRKRVSVNRCFSF